MAFGRLASLLVDIVINTRRVQSQLGTVQHQVRTATQNMRTSLTRIGLAASAILLVRKAIDLTLDGVKSSIKAFAELETQIIDIQKVARFGSLRELTNEYLQLGASIKGISFKEIGEIGGDLARLGVRGGSKGFIDFLEVASKFKIATGDIDLRNAGEGLGRILQNFNQELNATNALIAASTINKLADDFSVTSNEIFLTTQKLSGFASALGLTIQETTSLVTLLKQTGISSTVVESSLTRLFTLLESSPRQVAESLGLAGDAVSQFIITLQSDPIEAVRQLFEILNTLPIEKVVAFMKENEIATARNVPAILNATNRFKDFAKTQEAALSGMTAVANLLEKYSTTAGTAAANIQSLENKWELFKASLLSGETIIGNVIGKLEYFLSLITPDNDIGTDRGLPKTLEEVDEKLAKLREAKQTYAAIPFNISALGIIEYLKGQFDLGAEIYRLEQYRVELEKAITQENEAQVAAKGQLLEKEKERIKAEERARRNLAQQSEANLQLFRQRGFGDLQVDKKSFSIRERFEALAKAEKELYTGENAIQFHRMIDLMKELRIREEEGVELKKQELAHLKERNRIVGIVNSLKIDNTTNEYAQELMRLQEKFQRALEDLQEAGFEEDTPEVRILKRNKKASAEFLKQDARQNAELAATRFKLGILPSGGRAAEIVDRAFQLQDILRKAPPGTKLHPDLLKFLTLNTGAAPQFRGLTDAYFDAIQKTNMEKYQEEANKALQTLVNQGIEDKELKEKTLEAIKNPKPILN